MSVSRRRKVTFVLIGGSALLYIGCLLSPAFEILSPHADRAATLGLFSLIFGAIGHISSWAANPLLFFAWYNLYKGRGLLTFLAALAALLLALTFLRSGQELPNGSEGLYPYQVRFGYYIWLCSILLTAIAGLVHGRFESPETESRNAA